MSSNSLSSTAHPNAGPTPVNGEKLVEATRQACIQAALTAFEDASMNGLCCEGAWESAVGAMQQLDLGEILRDDWSRFAQQQFIRESDDDVEYTVSDAEEVYNS